jgi:hypothetical protein
MPYLLHRRQRGLRSLTEVTIGASADDRELVERIMTAYRLATSSFAWDSSSMWMGFFEQHHTGIHQALIAGDLETVSRALRDPGSSNLFYGFDSLGPVSDPAKDPYAPYTSLITLDRLVSFGEALGAIRLNHPEGYLDLAPRTFTADEVIESIEAAVGLELSFPAPFPGERGLPSRRGVIVPPCSRRALPGVARLQAHRLAQRNCTPGRDRRRLGTNGALRASIRSPRLHARRPPTHRRLVGLLPRPRVGPRRNRLLRRGNRRL